MAINIGAATRFSGSRDLRLREAVVPVLALAGALALYVAFRACLIGVAESTAANSLALDIAMFAAACLAVGVLYGEIPAILRPLLRGIAVVVLAQVICDAATLFYGPADIVGGWYARFFVVGGGLAISAGFLTLWRPSFALPLFVHYVAFRHQ